MSFIRLDTRYLWSALKLWRAKRLQATLSTLGIVVGVSGLVLVIALGEGANKELQSALGTLGAGSVVINSAGDEIGTRGSLNSDKLERIDTLLGESIKRISAVRQQQSNLFTPAANLSMRVVGTDRNYAGLYKLELHSGRFLTDLDNRENQRVCVLGWQAGKTLFPRGQVVGREVRIDRSWYKVVGWLKPSTYQMPKLEKLELAEVDQVIYVPAATLTDNLAGPLRYPLDQLVIQFNNEGAMTSSLDALKRIAEFDINQADLEYLVPIELLRQKQNLREVIQWLLVGIATLMLIVGGVGIMNMMMVNVISRRAEIGLRCAVGASRQHIITQFVTESLVIALAGGLAGILLGFLLSLIIDLSTDWSVKMNMASALIGFFTAVAIGVIFGSYPALQAASVSPVQSLRET